MATKTYELNIRFTLKDDSDDEFVEFKKDILNGEFQRAMMDDSKIGLTKVTATITEIKK